MVNDIQAKLANWISSGFAVTIILVRIAVSRQTPHTSTLCKLLCVLSILVVIARIPIIWLVLNYGTATTFATGGAPTDDLNYHRVKIGSILTLIARLLATTFYWLQTSLLLQFYTHVIHHIEWCDRAIKVCWVTIILTFVVCVLTTFLECRPFSLYWQIYPAVHHCTRAYVQIFTQGILNVVLDLMLLIISIPLWTGRQLSVAQMIRVGALLLLGTFCIIVNGVKLNFVVGARSNQNARTFWASVQILVSTFVANVPTIYGCVRNMLRRREEQRVRRTSRPESWVGIGLVRTQTSEQKSTISNGSRMYEFLDLSTDKVDVEHQELAR